ncbi:MAG TPA: hypothetical protein DD435_04690 [Cyanobacteria bacterium UBA8530]|nr:hypothetical protein [Cyanobacteria bacterium UBA8530]
MRRALWVCLVSAALGALVEPAEASTLPQADFYSNLRYFGLGAGNDNVAASLDLPFSDELMFGGSISLPGFGLGYARIPLWDVHGVYQFVDGGKHDLSIAGIFGAWGGSRWSGDSFTNLELGFGLAFPFTNRLTGRFNLIVPYYGTIPGPYYYTFGGPASGAELGYLFSSKLEGTLGVNGHGSILGLTIRF